MPTSIRPSSSIGKNLRLLTTIAEGLTKERNVPNKALAYYRKVLELPVLNGYWQKQRQELVWERIARLTEAQR